MVKEEYHDDNNSPIASNFSKYAQVYDRHAHIQKIMASRLASFIPDKTPKQILEIGCGTGLFTRHLLIRQLNNLILNDISREMIKLLQKKISLPNSTSIIIGNAEALKFELVDIISANAVFQWFKTPDATLKRLNSFLKPNGNLIFSTFGPATLTEFRKTASLKSPALLLSIKEWEKIIINAGFLIKSSSSDIHKSFFNNTLSLMKNLQQLGATPTRMIRSGELRQLISKYDEKYSTKQGIHATWEILYFSAINKP